MHHLMDGEGVADFVTLLGTVREALSGPTEVFQEDERGGGISW